MGQPSHYGIQLPERCLKLIDSLWNHVQNVTDIERSYLGPLTSTFLLSMAMPIINLPIERIERNIDKSSTGYADDRDINANAEKAIKDVIKKGLLKNAPFFEKDAWSFAKECKKPFFNIADGIPESIAVSLGDDAAKNAAQNMQASEWISVLRNALAHGGIVYLDEYGRSGQNSQVQMYAFVSGKYDRPKCKHGEGQCPNGRGDLVCLKVLRIKEDDFRSFLKKWVNWLSDTV